MMLVAQPLRINLRRTGQWRRQNTRCKATIKSRNTESASSNMKDAPQK